MAERVEADRGEEAAVLPREQLGLRREREAWPWETTREVYFTFVDVSYRQLTNE